MEETIIQTGPEKRDKNQKLQKNLHNASDFGLKKNNALEFEFKIS